MLEDLQAEATRIRAGRPTPSSCRDDEFGFEGAGQSGSSGSSAARSPPGAAGHGSSGLTMDRCRAVSALASE